MSGQRGEGRKRPEHRRDGVEEPCGGRGTEERGLETFKGALRLGRPGSAGLRQVDKVMGTDGGVYA